MTLTKTKPKPVTAEHRKRHGQHHRHSHDYVKTYWPYLPVLAILTAGMLTSSWLGHANRSVLGFATDMSVQTLLADTNEQRVQAGETALQLNTRLDDAAQAKANDMAAKDYWSHNTPDGKTPWTFIAAAGYNYQAAGENLAYGFATAADTITGWMNSPEHRANILNANYSDVGFGIANIGNYQDSGPETLVVAMYGAPAGNKAAPVSSSPHTASPGSTKPTVRADTARPEQQSAQQQPKPNNALTTTLDSANPVVNADTIEPGQQRISQLQLTASSVPMNTFALVTLGTAAALFLVIRHSRVWRRALVHGEAFVLRYPLLDIAAVTVVASTLVLAHTAGLIR